MKLMGPPPPLTPQEFHAEETLQTLEPFLRNLGDLCLRAADELEEEPVSASFDRVLDDLATVNQLFTVWSRVFPAGAAAELPLLRAEFLSLIQDLEQFSDESGRSHRISLLRSELPGFTEELRIKGIPLLTRLSTFSSRPKV